MVKQVRLRKETVGRGVRVTLIEPGLVDTPIVRNRPKTESQ